MYNEERKMKFLTGTRSSPDFGKSVFRTTEPYEQEAGADLCELQLDVLQEIADRNFGFRTQTVDSTLAILRTYVLWCKEQGYRTEEGIFQVKIRMEDKMRRFMVASPKHLQSILDKVFAPVEEGTVDCIYRCLMWMAFAGVEEADALEVKTSEINFDKMLIEHQGGSFEIYREAVPAFKMACEATEFVYQHPLYGDEIKRSRFPGEYLMRGIRSEKLRLNTARGWVGKALKEKDIELSYGKLQISGLFYQAFELERFGQEVNFDDLVAERTIKTDHASSKNHKKHKLPYSKKKNLMDDYICWKSVFGGRTDSLKGL